MMMIKNNERPGNLVELQVDVNEINIAQGDTCTVNITSGNGEYVATSANEEVVVAEIDGNVVKLTAVEGIIMLKELFMLAISISNALKF